MRFASARRLGFPVLRVSTTTTPFVRFLPHRTDREHDPSKGRFLAAPVGPAGAWSIPRRSKSPRSPDDFRHPRERRVSPRRSGSRSSTFLAERRRGRESEPCVRRLHRSCERLASPARAESPESRSPSSVKERKTRAPTRRRLEHLLVTDRVRESLESPFTPRPAEDTPDVSRPAKGNERTSASRCFSSSITRSRA